MSGIASPDAPQVEHGVPKNISEIIEGKEQEFITAELIARGDVR